MGKTIGIVGAGVSGILACKYALAKGYDPIVFESRSTLGGVWTKTMEITKLQTLKQFYQFSDFPWPSEIETSFPTQAQVYNYLNSYAKHFGLLKHIRFNTKVVSVMYDGPSEKEMQSWDLWGGNGEPFGNKGTWLITIEDPVTHSIEVQKVDFTVLCLGQYSDVPNIPEFPKGKGQEVFEGKVLHSMEYTNMDHVEARKLVKGKRVTVVGSRKSALDIAMECSNANDVEHPCTIICRTPRWSAPNNLSWGKALGNLHLTRFGELLVHKPGDSPLFAAITLLLSPLIWIYTKCIEHDLKKKHPLEKFNMVPDQSFVDELNTCSIAVIPDGFYNNVEKGSLVMKRSPSFHFCKNGVRLDYNGHQDEKPVVKSDLVIFATGYKGGQKFKDVFASPVFQNYIMGSPNKALPLYRQCIHPRIPQLAVIGFSEGVSHLHVFEMRCRWLMELLDGKFKVPSIGKMENDISEWDKFMKKHTGKYYRKSCITGLQIWYNDQLCKDMGFNPKRKKGFWAELFEPYGPMDYALN